MKKEYSRILDMEDSINKLVIKEIDEEIVFFDKDIKEFVPFRENEELTFVYLVSLLYSLFIERARPNTKIIIDIMKAKNVENVEKHEKFCEELICLRTYLFHTLKKKKGHYNNAIYWFGSICPSSEPTENLEWMKCNEKLINDALDFMKDMYDVIELLIRMNDKILIEAWIVKAKKDMPDYRLSEITNDVFTTFSLNYDVQTFVKANNAEIRKKISTRDFDSIDQIYEQVRLIIEEIIYCDDYAICPVDGNTLMDRYQITGKKIGDYYKAAKAIHIEDRSLTKEEILDKLDKMDLLS